MMSNLCLAFQRRNGGAVEVGGWLGAPNNGRRRKERERVQCGAKNEEEDYGISQVLHEQRLDHSLTLSPYNSVFL